MKKGATGISSTAGHPGLDRSPSKDILRTQPYSYHLHDANSTPSTAGPFHKAPAGGGVSAMSAENYPEGFQ